MIEKSKRSTDRTLRALNVDMEEENTSSRTRRMAACRRC